MPSTDRTIADAEQRSPEVSARRDGYAAKHGEWPISLQNAASGPRYRLMKLAVAMWGDEAAAFDWMKAPHMELQGDTPESLLGTAAGIRRVENLLSALENGFPV